MSTKVCRKSGSTSEIARYLVGGFLLSPHAALSPGGGRGRGTWVSVIICLPSPAYRLFVDSTMENTAADHDVEQIARVFPFGKYSPVAKT